MNTLKVIIYGTGLMGKELLQQIECYNRIQNEQFIEVKAFTESENKGGGVKGIAILPIEECSRLAFDYVIIASAYYDEIIAVIKSKTDIDLRKVVKKEQFYPQNNGLSLSQINSAYYYRKLIPIQQDMELLELYRKFEKPENFIDIFNRRRFVETRKEIERYLDTEIFFDEKENLKYVLVDDKRLYYPFGWSEEKIREYHALNMYTCNAKTSAHRYLDDDFAVEANDIVADIGAAEGFFALSVIEQVKRVYLFEADEKWMRALQATFKPYKEKIVLENKFVSNINQWDFITLDTYFRDKEISLIKMDIEGEEQKALLGCIDLLKRKKMRWLITTYHRSEDMEFIDAFMKERGYHTTRVSNYLWIDQANLDVRFFGEFRKAMLRAVKKIVSSDL